MPRLSNSILALLLLCPALPVRAQSPAAATAANGCTYSTCALRIEPGFLGARIVRGSSGESVSRVSGFGGGVGVLLAGPDSAARYAQSFVGSSRNGMAFGLLGGLMIGAALARADQVHGSDDASAGGLMIAGAGLTLVSAHFTLRAQRALSRSVWWYNAALSR